MKIVLQKLIASSSYYSRRKAEELIKDGRVELNGEIANPGDRADKGDQIKIDGSLFETKDAPIATYIKLNKPVKYVCSNRKFKDEKNIFDLIKTKQKLFAIGRLDKDSHGLVLLTNDGNLTQKLTHPSFEHEKVYKVKVKGPEKYDIEEIIEEFKKGVNIGQGDGVVKVKDITYPGGGKFEITLTQGKKRQIRRMFGKFNLEVADLQRTQIAGLDIGNLKIGEHRHLTPKETEYIRQFI